MSGKKSKQARKSNARRQSEGFEGSSLWDFKHRWEEVAGLRFITLWRNQTIIAVTSEANHYIQAFVALKNAGIASGHDDLVDVDWVYKWQAFLDHFSPANSSRCDSDWAALPEDQRAFAAAMASFVFLQEVEERDGEGFTWHTPIQEVIDHRIQSYGFSKDGTRVVRKP